MPRMIKRLVTLIELFIGVLLPWKARCRYSGFLMRLDGNRPIDVNADAIEGRRRDFDTFFNLGSLFAREENVERAIENFKKALNADNGNSRAKDAYVALAHCYRQKGDKDKFADAMLNSYGYGKRPAHSKS
jgi:tetratricopeptide (TPR) repeat protein